MPFEDLSKEELISTLDLIETAQRSHGAVDMQRLILKASGLVEADHAVCALVRPGADGQASVTSYINGNYPEEWVRRYLESSYHLKDPIVRYHTRYAFTQTWKEVFGRFEDESAAQVVGEAGDFGLKFGITGALYLPDVDNIALFTFAGGKDRFGAHQKRLADILSMHLSTALTRCASECLGTAGRFDDQWHPTEREGKAW